MFCMDSLHFFSSLVLLHLRANVLIRGVWVIVVVSGGLGGEVASGRRCLWTRVEDVEWTRVGMGGLLLPRLVLLLSLIPLLLDLGLIELLVCLLGLAELACVAVGVGTFLVGVVEQDQSVVRGLNLRGRRTRGQTEVGIVVTGMAVLRHISGLDGESSDVMDDMKLVV
jgi:hypothetical protein